MLPNAKFVNRLLEITHKNRAIRFILRNNYSHSHAHTERRGRVISSSEKRNKPSRCLITVKMDQWRKQMREFAETEFLPDTKDRFNLSCILLKSETRGYLLPPSPYSPSLSYTYTSAFSLLSVFDTTPRGMLTFQTSLLFATQKHIAGRGRTGLKSGLI